MQWQSEQPKPAIGVPFSPMRLAVGHSSVLSAFLKRTSVIFAASLASR